LGEHDKIEPPSREASAVSKLAHFERFGSAVWLLERQGKVYFAVVDFYQELKNLVVALESSQIEYALCGGVALAIHGAPRATQDIDLLLRREDLDRLRDTARSCGFVFESVPMDFASGVTMQRFSKLIDGQPFMLDALLVTPALENIWNARQHAEFEGGNVRVVSMEGLISLKLVAGRPQDLVDIQRLQEVQRG
jgi:hypothetical protein